VRGSLKKLYSSGSVRRTSEDEFKFTMEVPEILLVSVLLRIQALMTLRPGAKMSTTEPKLEKEALASRMVEAPTVTAPEARAGEVLRASVWLFPAATCYERE